MSLENLTHFGLRAGVDMRPTLIRVLTDLYVQKLTHTPEEERHYTELALRLLDAVDVASRVAVAERLSRHFAPPLRVIERLAVDQPEVAAPVRAHPIMARKPQASPPAPPIGETDDLVKEVVDAVADVAAAVAKIADATPPDAREPREETRPPAEPSSSAPLDIASDLNEQFFAADANERRLILLNFHIVMPAAPDRAERSGDASVGLRLETAALTRNREDLAQQFAHALHIPRAQARRIVGDELGEPIVIGAKALKLPRDVVHRILLFANPAIGHSVERVHTLATLYDEMTVEAAEQMVAIWQSLHDHERPALAHRPVHWNDERSRARTATTTVRRAPAPHRRSERRDVS
jgi:hypothetical protein